VVVKQRYRIIDFKRTKEGIPATVKSIEYDPNCTYLSHWLKLMVRKRMLLPNGLKVGSVVSGPESQLKGE
jgi:large subunit ribosomal protein L2